MQPILFYTANNGQQQYLTIYPSLFLEPLTTYWGGAGDTLLSDVLAGKALDSDMQEAKAGLSGLAETQGVLVASVSNNTAMLVAVSNATIGVWSNAVVTGDTVWLDWSISQTWRIDVTNLAFTIDCTNTPFAFAPQRMKVQLLTPTDATPSFSWPTNISWSSQVDVTSNRVYNILLEWDGWRYVGATFNSHDR